MEMQIVEYNPKQILKLGLDSSLASEAGKNDVIEFVATPDTVSWRTKQGKTVSVDITKASGNQFQAECDVRLLGVDYDFIMPMNLSFNDGEDKKIIEDIEIKGHNTRTHAVYFTHLLADVMGTKRFDVVLNDGFDFNLNYSDDANEKLIDFENQETGPIELKNIADTAVIEKFDLNNTKTAYHYQETADKIIFHKPKYTIRQAMLYLMMFVFIALVITGLATIPYMFNRYSNAGVALFSLAVGLAILGFGMVSIYSFYGRTIPERIVTFFKSRRWIVIKTNNEDQIVQYDDIESLQIESRSLISTQGSEATYSVIVANTNKGQVDLFCPVWKYAKSRKKFEKFHKLTMSFQGYLENEIFK